MRTIEAGRLLDELIPSIRVAEALKTPHDYLCENKGRGWNPTGFFPMPHSVVECMVQ